MTARPLVYIAGPYTHPDPVWNTHNAVREAEKVEALGCDVVIPHLSLLWHAISPAPVERWYERDLAVMHRCDALVRLPGDSAGADAEVKEFRGRTFAWPIEAALVKNWIDHFDGALTDDQPDQRECTNGPGSAASKLECAPPMTDERSRDG